MGDNYRVRVLAVDPARRRARLRFTVLYYDAALEYCCPLPDDASLFLGALLDHGSPASPALGEDFPDIDGDPYRYEDAIDSNAYRFIERFERRSVRNHPVADWSVFAGDDAPDRALVRADYDVFVTDAKYLRGLTSGQHWGTAAYQTRADRLALEEAPRLPDLRLERCRLTPFAGPEDRGTPSAMVFSDDGRHLALASVVGELVVYETASWRERWRSERAPFFDSLQFWPGAAVLQANDDYKQRFAAWDVETGRSVAPRRLPGRVRSRSGRLYAAWGEGNVLTIRDADGRALRELAVEARSLEGAYVTFSEDERLVALLCGYGGPDPERAHTWSTATGAPAGVFSLGDSAHAVAFSPDGAYLATALVRREAAVMRLRDGEFVRRGRRVYEGRRTPADTHTHGVAYSPRGGLLAVLHTYANDGYGGHVTVHEVGASWPSRPTGGARP
jgi:hypothetical protein